MYIQRQLVDTIRGGNKIQELSKNHPTWMFKDIWAEAAVEDTAKGEVVVFGTKTYRPCMYKIVHKIWE